MQSNVDVRSASTAGERVWKIVLLFTFLIMMFDGADLVFLSYTLPGIKQEFGLSHVQAGSLGSITLLGMAIGGIAGGWIMDRYGRVRTAVWSIFLFTVGTAAVGLSRTYEEFALIRFIAALGMGAQYAICNTLMAEYVPTRYRTTALSILQSGWSVGYVLAALLAGLILPSLGWRWLYYVGIFPVILAILMPRFVQEPPVWQQARDRRQQQGKDKMAPLTSPQQPGIISTLFHTPMHRRMFILWSLAATFLQFGYYGVVIWMPTYLEKELHLKLSDLTTYMVGSYCAMIFGKILAGWLADHFGRRLLFIIGTLGTAAFLPLIVFYHTADNIVYLLITFGFIYGIPYGVNATYMTESFEARIRGSAVAGAYNIGRIGASIAPAVIGFVATQGSIGQGFLLMGLAYFICGIIPALFIPERIYDPQKN